VDLPIKAVDDMLSVNVQAVTALTHLFGRDMKERRRGRILMVSSVNGAVSGIPTVSVYTATKAFERTLATSLAREMEPYGVGVTCLLPGAVRDTDFRSHSNSHGALCWKIPFYLKSPAQVAEMGVRALLMGQPEVTPGWMNRVFLKVVQPAMPPRMHSLIAEIMWNPLRMPWHRRADAEDADASKAEPEPSPVSPPTSDLRAISTRLRYKFDPAPRLLTLEDNSTQPVEGAPVNSTSAVSTNVDASSSDASSAADPATAIPTMLENELPAGRSAGPGGVDGASNVAESDGNGNATPSNSAQKQDGTRNLARSASSE
jgi:short chain dehydrogenase